MTSSRTRSTAVRGQRVERGVPAGGGVHLEALAPEATGQHVAVVLVVVDDQDDAASLGRRSGVRGGGRRRPCRLRDGRHPP